MGGEDDGCENGDGEGDDGENGGGGKNMGGEGKNGDNGCGEEETPLSQPVVLAVMSSSEFHTNPFYSGLVHICRIKVIL